MVLAKPPIAQVPELVGQLCSLVDQLEHLFPGRKFTLDGHLVGSIGEVVAAHRYGLELLPASAETHDARADDGRLVQIKLTQTRSVGLRGEPDHLIVLQLARNGSATEIYNGPGGLAWNAAGKMQSNGQRQISLRRLQNLMLQVPATDRLAPDNG